MTPDGGSAKPPAPIPLDDAIARIRVLVLPIAEFETLDLRYALGRALAEAAIAARALPPFDNTAVDGYAFRRDDVTETVSVRLKLAGESAAGVPYAGILPPGTTIRISTGAVLPDGADTVAMQEDCRRDGDAVIIDPVPPLGANLRRAGNDIKQGEVALDAGHRLRAQDISLLRALGFVDANVRRKLRIAIAPTGAELREGGADLGPGQIVETNGLMLAQLLDRMPVEISMLETLPDDRSATTAALAAAARKYDLIVTTGGVSVGDHDHVRPALESVGQLHFWRLSIRPGKPVLFGQIGDAFVLGLPGNPVSALATFLTVGRAIIEALLGTPARPLPGYPVPLAEAFRKPQSLRDFSRARLEWSEAGPQVRPFRDQSSNLLTSLSWADGLLDLPSGKAEFAQGETVIFRPFAELTA